LVIATTCDLAEHNGMKKPTPPGWALMLKRVIETFGKELSRRILLP